MIFFTTLRAWFFLLFLPVYTLFCSIVILTTNILFNQRKIDNKVIRFWAKGICKMAGVKIHVSGMENIPAGGCLFLFNHTSFFDIFAIYTTLPEVRFGAKVELFKLPFFGYAMKRVGILPIDRSQREKVYRHYEKSKSRVEAGERFALAPEGTRQEQEVLAPFKAGPFVFAINSKAPVVPLVIKGASKVLPKKTYLVNRSTWTRDIYMHILKPIPTTEITVETRSELQKKVYDVMNPYFTTSQLS